MNFKWNNINDRDIYIYIDNVEKRTAMKLSTNEFND